MAANAIVAICTVLMVGAIIWVVVGEHNAPDHDEDEEKENEKKKDSEDEQ